MGAHRDHDQDKQLLKMNEWINECCMDLACCVTFHDTEASYSTSSPFHATLGSKSKPRTICVLAEVADLFHIAKHYL